MWLKAARASVRTKAANQKVVRFFSAARISVANVFCLYINYLLMILGCQRKVCSAIIFAYRPLGGVNKGNRDAVVGGRLLLFFYFGIYLSNPLSNDISF